MRLLSTLLPSAALLAATASAAPHHKTTTKHGPFLQSLNTTAGAGWVIGNDHWNITIGSIFGTKLYYKGKDLVGNASGHYAGYDGENNFLWTSAAVHENTSEHLDVVFSSTEVDLHWVILPGLHGAYQYVVNKALPTLGVLRTLYRLDNTTFTHGRTNVKDAALPPLSDFLNATKVQDETWQRADGSFITKYDFSAFVREIDFHGVYGSEFGSWYIRPGRDYLNGNQLKQELTVHRESRTGDAVELNVIHGSHFQVTSRANFPVGKTWGPWLWYLNDGSPVDAALRAADEFESWPYPWLKDSSYQSRGSVSGRLVLSDGRPASGAAVFLGDNRSNVTTLDQGANYQYTTYADGDGNFQISDVRASASASASASSGAGGGYALTAWASGGKIANVSTTFTQNDIFVTADQDVDLGALEWAVPESRRQIWQIGDIDHTALGFKNSGVYQHGLAAKSPANLSFVVGKNGDGDWYYAQSSLGSWSVHFELDGAEFAGSGSNSSAANGTLGQWTNSTGATRDAVLGVSLAGYSQSADLIISVNGQEVGSLLKDNLASDPALYRSGTVAGEWRYYEFSVDGALLKQGKNEVVFTVTRFTLWRGFLWDSIFLAWES